MTRSFTEQDIKILSSEFDVKTIDFNLSKKTVIPLGLRILCGVIWADVTFSWFADLHAVIAVFLSRLFRKKSIVVAGGYDVACEPEIDYGLMRFPKSRLARAVRFALQKANRVLAVSEFNKQETLKYANDDQIILVYNAVDCDNFQPKGKKDDRLVVTVAGITNQTLDRKGLTTFVKAAHYLPDVKFIVIGKDYDASLHTLQKMSSENVEFIGYVPFDEIKIWYQKAQVYCQLSYYESFGLSLAEAMACECVPVVTGKAALPEVVGSTGFCVPYGNPKETAEAIKKALCSSNGRQARMRIKELFPIEKRRNDLIALVERL